MCPEDRCLLRGYGDTDIKGRRSGCYGWWGGSRPSAPAQELTLGKSRGGRRQPQDGAGAEAVAVFTSCCTQGEAKTRVGPGELGRARQTCFRRDFEEKMKPEHHKIAPEARGEKPEFVRARDQTDVFLQQV